MGKRMYYVLKIIIESKEETIRAKEIVEKLKVYHIHVDIKTVYSCIRQINEFFYEWLQADMIVSYRRKGFKIENEFLGDGEIQFLLDSVAFHQDLNHEDKEKLKQKLLRLSSQHQKSRLVPYIPHQKHFSFSLLLNLSTIMKAIENKKALSFQYINYDVYKNHLVEIASQKGNVGNLYILSPYQIVTQNNHYYLIGYNEKYPSQLTNYRIDRMRMIQLLKKGYQEIREQFDMIDEIEKMTNMYVSHQRSTLEIECDQRLLREIVSRFGQDVYVQKLYQDHYHISIKDVSISEGLIGWIMMMQDQIRVIAPEFLKDDIKKRIQKMYDLYEDML